MLREMTTPLLVVYATQTGNAEDAAELLGREAALRHYEPRVLSADACDLGLLLSVRHLLFVVSTAGQGESPESFVKLWRALLRKSLPASALSHCHVAVFGLGDRSYVHFNVVAKKLDRRLETLGANKLLPLGLGDDQHPLGYDAALGAWTASLWPALRATCPLPAGAPPDPPPGTAPPPPRVRVHVQLLPGRSAGPLPSTIEAAFNPQEVQACMSAAKALRDALAGSTAPAETPAARDGLRRYSREAPFLARLAVNRRLTVTDDSRPRDVRHLELQLTAEGPQHQPGDALAIAPLAPIEGVQALLERLNIPSDAVLCCQVEDSNSGGGTKVTQFEAAARHLVRGWLDTSSATPRRSFLALLADTARAAHEADRLRYFSSPQGRDDCARYASRERRNVVEVLHDFPSASPSLGLLLQAAPRLHARLFSISSSAALHPGWAHITAAVVQWTTPLKRSRTGLLTSQLVQLPGGCSDIVLPVWTVPGSLRLPADPNVPVLMVGPGTGVAPFRAFVQHAQAQVDSTPAGAAAGIRPMALFFGCRHKGADELYADEWTSACEPGMPLSSPAGGYFVAYSRDVAGSKRYVTHLLREQGHLVWQLLSAGAHVYVAGAAGAMPRDVFEALSHVVHSHAPGMSSLADAETWLRQLDVQRRYHVEVWA